MVKPPEVTIKEDEEGHIVREDEQNGPDTDDLAMYLTVYNIICQCINEFI